MTENRILSWDGCTNVRDLGGLTTTDDRVTRHSAVVRADHPAKLTEAGWASLQAYGIRTIIRLGTFGMTDPNHPDDYPRPADIITVNVDIEDVTDLEFREKWGASDLWSTPLYYEDALARWPERHAAAIAAIANAQPGGVLIHCVRGVDRTGIVALLLLAAVGVRTDDIIADYELSIDPERERLLAAENTTTREVLLSVLEGLDVEAYLREGGLSEDDLDSVRARLLDGAGTAGAA